MTCSKCNHKNTPGMKYCGSCGNPLSSAPVQGSQPPRQTYAAPPTPQTPMYQPPPQAPYTAPPTQHQTPAHHTAQSTYTPPAHHQSTQPYVAPQQPSYQQQPHFTQSQPSGSSVSHGRVLPASQIPFSIIAAAAFITLFLPAFTLTFLGVGETMIFMDLLFDSRIRLNLQDTGIGYVRLFAAVLLLSPVILALLHNFWRFANQPKNVLFVASIAISAAGMIMPLLIWAGMQNMIPTGWGEFGVDPHIGFFAVILVYGASLVLSLVLRKKD